MVTLVYVHFALVVLPAIVGGAYFLWHTYQDHTPFHHHKGETVAWPRNLGHT